MSTPPPSNKAAGPAAAATPREKDPLHRLGNDPVLLVFGARWATPTQLLEPTVAEIEDSGIRVRRIDVDTWPQHAETFRVVMLPTLVWVREGSERRRLVGAVSPKEIKAFTRRK